MTSPLTVEWFGCTTFRVRVGGVTLFFDTFVDRIAAAEPAGIRSEGIDEADFLFISHSHLDHILGADTIACNTGAPVVGSHETMRVMAANGVPAEQRWAVSGGETVDCGAGVTVRALPGQHSCLWASNDPDTGAPCQGDLGMAYQEQRVRTEEAWNALYAMSPEVAEYLTSRRARWSQSDGGQLNYLLETPEGSIFFTSSVGCWSGIVRELRPDVAFLAVSGRPNIDGEPFQGSLAEYIAGMVETLGPRTVAFCHHDAWMPPVPAIDVEPVVRELARRTPSVAVATLAMGEPVQILAR